MSHLIGHEGKGSILSELKRRGWSNNLLAGHTTSGRGFGFFDITVDLTQEGLENVDEISKIIFQVRIEYFFLTGCKHFHCEFNHVIHFCFVDSI